MIQRNKILSLIIVTIFMLNVISLVLIDEKNILLENQSYQEDNNSNHLKISNGIENELLAYSGGEEIILTGTLNYRNSTEVSLDWFIPCQLMTVKIKLPDESYITLESPEGGDATDITSGKDSNGNLIDDITGDVSPFVLNDTSVGKYNITASIPDRSEWDALGLTSGPATIVAQYGGNTTVTGWDDLIDTIDLSEIFILEATDISADPIQQGETTIISIFSGYQGGSGESGIQLNWTLTDDLGVPINLVAEGITILANPGTGISNATGYVDFTITTNYPNSDEGDYIFEVSGYHTLTTSYVHDSRTFTIANNVLTAEVIYDNVDINIDHLSTDVIAELVTIRQGYNLSLTVRTEFSNTTGVANAGISFDLLERSSQTIINPNTYSITLTAIGGATNTNSGGYWQINFNTSYGNTQEMEYTLRITADFSILGLEDPPDYLLTSSDVFLYNITVDNMYDKVTIIEDGAITHTEEVRLVDVETIIPMKLQIEEGMNPGTYYLDSDIPQTPIIVNITDSNGIFGNYPGVTVSVRSYNGVIYQDASLMNGWYLTDQDGKFQVVIQCSWPELYDRYTFKVNITANLSWDHLDPVFEYIKDETGSTEFSSSLTTDFAFDPNYGIGEIELLLVTGAVETSPGLYELRPGDQAFFTFHVFYYNENLTTDISMVNIWVNLQMVSNTAGVYITSTATPSGTPGWYLTDGSGEITFNVTAVYGEVGEVEGGINVGLNVTADFYNGNQYAFVVGNQHPVGSDYPDSTYAVFNQSWTYLLNQFEIDPMYDIYFISYISSNTTVTDTIRPGDTVALVFRLINSDTVALANIPVDIEFVGSSYTASFVLTQNITDSNGYVTFYVKTVFDATIKEFTLTFNVTADLSQLVGYSWKVGERILGAGPRSQASYSTFDTAGEFAVISVEPLYRYVELISAPAYPTPSQIQQTDSTIVAFLAQYDTSAQNIIDGVDGQPIEGITVSISATELTNNDLTANATLTTTNSQGIAYFNISTSIATVQDIPYKINATADLFNDNDLYDINNHFVNGTVVFVSGNVTTSIATSNQFLVHNSKQIVTEIKNTYDKEGNSLSIGVPWLAYRGSTIEIEATYKDNQIINPGVVIVGETLIVKVMVMADGSKNITQGDLSVVGSLTTNIEGKILVNLTIPENDPSTLNPLIIKDMDIIIEDPNNSDEEQTTASFSVITDITIFSSFSYETGNIAYLGEDITFEGYIADDLGTNISSSNGIHDLIYGELAGQILLTQKNTSYTFGTSQSITLAAGVNTFTTVMTVSDLVTDSSVTANIAMNPTSHFTSFTSDYSINVFQQITFNQIIIRLGIAGEGPYTITNSSLIQFTSFDGDGYLTATLHDNHGRILTDRSVSIYWNGSLYSTTTDGSGNAIFSSNLIIPDNVYVAPFDCSVLSLINGSVMGNTLFQVERLVVDIYEPNIVITNLITSDIDINVTTITITADDINSVISGINTASGIIYIDGSPYALVFLTQAGNDYLFSYDWATSIDDLPGAGPYNITVYLEDDDGNSNTVTQFFTLDRTAPTITVSSPTGEYVYGVFTLEFDLQDAENEVNPTTAYISVDGGAFDTFTVNYEYDIDTSILSSEFDVIIRVKDNAGNFAEETFLLKVDSFNPTIEFLGLTEDAYYGIEVNFTLILTDIGTGLDNTSLILSDNGDLLIDGVDYLINERNIISATNEEWDISWSTSGTVIVDHKLSATISDKAGLIDNTSISIKIDVIAPNIQISDLDDINGYEIEFQVDVTDIGGVGVNTSSFNIIDSDGKQFTGVTITNIGNVWTITWDASYVTDNQRRLDVYVKDLADNEASERVIIDIDIEEPAILVSYSEDDGVTSNNLEENTTSESLSGNEIQILIVVNDNSNFGSMDVDWEEIIVYLDGEIQESVTFSDPGSSYMTSGILYLDSDDFAKLDSKHNLTIVASDNAGNEAIFSATLKIYHEVALLTTNDLIIAGIAFVLALVVGIAIAFAYERYAYEY